MMMIFGNPNIRFKPFFRMMLVMIGLGLFYHPATFASDLKTPDPSIKPVDVVRIQLEALMNNDMPEVDFGIKQTWAFAHPGNRSNTGPYKRFVNLIKNPSYSPLINHLSHTITEQNRSTSWVQFKVLMEDKNGDVLAFAWVVKKANEAPFVDCWMTSGVSPPLPAGQGS